MKPDTCKEILINYLKEHEGIWIRKGALYSVAEEAGFSPETGARKLREAANDGILHVEYYDGVKGQKLAKYAYNPAQEKKLSIKVVDGVAYQIYA